MLCLAVAYIIINLSYALLHEPIYSILTWVDWFSYVLGIAALVMGIVMYAIGLVAYNFCCKLKSLKEKIRDNKQKQGNKREIKGKRIHKQ